MKTQSAKAKGRTLQKLVRDSLLKIFPSLTPDDIRSTGMGQSGLDIQLSTAAQKLIPWAIECKSRAKIAVYEFFKQAETNSTDSLKPLLIIKQNRSEPLVVLTLKDFICVLKKQWKQTEEQLHSKGN